MSLPVDLAAASREELMAVVGQLLSYAGALEARIKELEGQRKPPTGGVKPGTPPAWVKANRPARSKQQERKKRTHGFARRREEPTHRVEHATASCPDCQVPLQGGIVRRRRQGDFPAPGAGKGDGARGAGTDLLKVPEAVGPRTGLERHHRGPPAVRRLGAKRSERAAGGVPAPLQVDTTLPEGAFWTEPQRGPTVALTRGVAQRGRQEYARLQEEIRASPVVYGDETGWREDGRNGYLWSFSTPKARYFTYRSSRSRHVVEEALGEEFEGGNCSDLGGSADYSAYGEGATKHGISTVNRFISLNVNSYRGGTGQRLLRSLQRISGAPPEMLDPPAAGHPPTEGAVPGT